MSSFSGSTAGGERRIERAIVLHLLGEDDAQRVSRTQLARALGAHTPPLQAALQRLSDVGVVCLDGDQAWASPAARHIDELGLIGI